MATKKDIALVRELRPSNRLTSLAAEFEQHSQAEIERLGSDNPDFDENFYHEAVSLVLRKLSRYRKE